MGTTPIPQIGLSASTSAGKSKVYDTDASQSRGRGSKKGRKRWRRHAGHCSRRWEIIPRGAHIDKAHGPTYRCFSPGSIVDTQKYSTVETGYRADICPTGNLPYFQIYPISGHPTVHRVVICPRGYLPNFQIYPITMSRILKKNRF